VPLSQVLIYIPRTADQNKCVIYWHDMAPRLRATDLYLLTLCNRQVYLDHHGDPGKRVQVSGYQAHIVREGIEFEQQIVSSLYGASKPEYKYHDLDTGFQATLELMQKGVPAIYQGVLIHDDLVGIPDLLERMPGDSRFGSYHYRPIDIKTSSASQAGQRLQVMAYMALLEAIQGVRPEGALLLRRPLADQQDDLPFYEECIVFEPEAYAESIFQLRAVVDSSEPLPFYSSVCGSCGWQGYCTPIVEQTRDASLIPGLRRAVWEGLHARGLGTLGAVAESSRDALLGIKGVGEKTADFLIRQAQAQHQGQPIRFARPDIFPADPANFFDIESLPSDGLYYLMGTAVVENRQVRFEYDIARSAEQEPEMWQSFLARIEALDGPVYHYGNFEKTSIKRLMERYGDDPRGQRLLDRLVDLEKCLKESVVLPLKGYSLKDVAPFLGFEWSGSTQTADGSIVEYLHWLEDGEHSHLDNILRYNEDDCLATVEVYRWLISQLE